jgi:hypothetical protein
MIPGIWTQGRGPFEKRFSRFDRHGRIAQGFNGSTVVWITYLPKLRGLCEAGVASRADRVSLSRNARFRAGEVPHAGISHGFGSGEPDQLPALRASWDLEREEIDAGGYTGAVFVVS